MHLISHQFEDANLIYQHLYNENKYEEALDYMLDLNCQKMITKNITII